MSLQARVALGALAAVALTLGLVLTIVVSTFATSERNNLDREIKRSATALVAAAAGNARTQKANPPVSPSGQTKAPPPTVKTPRQEPLSTRVQQATPKDGEVVEVVSAAGDVLATAGPMTAATKFPVPDRIDDLETISVGGHEYRTLAEVVTTADAAKPVLPPHVIVAADTSEMNARIESLRTRVVVIGLAGLLLAAVIAFFLARLSLRALDRLRDRATEVSEPGATGPRLPTGGPREIDDLASTLNAMLDRIAHSRAEREAVLEASRRFAADVGHELRTPLFAMGANLDTLRAHPEATAERGDIVTELSHEQRRMAALLSSLQALARGDAPESIAREAVDLSELADAAVQSSRRRHREITFTLVAPDDASATFSAWPGGLLLALENLLENAARHGRPDGSVTLTVTPEPGGVTITVDDDGPGIPVAERATVTERFVRGENVQAAGSGLGLALVAQQAALHGGTLTIEDSPAGGARLRLQLVSAPASLP